MIRLPLLAVIRDAFALPWRHRGELFRAVGLPLVALIAVTLFWESLYWSDGYLAQWAPHFVYLITFSWLAVTVHRLVLLDATSVGGHFSARTWKRIAVYVLAFAAISIVFLAIKFLLMNAIGIASGINYTPVGAEPNRIAQQWLNWGSTLAALLVVSRLILVLPSIAVDKGHEFKESWRSTRGNAWRLAVVYGVLPWALSWLQWRLYRDGASKLEYALLVVLGGLMALVEIVALSLSFAALTAPAPPPTNPPA